MQVWSIGERAERRGWMDVCMRVLCAGMRKLSAMATVFAEFVKFRNIEEAAATGKPR